jgi:hypothetical protein
MAAFLGLIAAVTAALIARSVMVSNHRQAWINGLRDDLAQFFTAIDQIHFRIMAHSQVDTRKLGEEQRKARNDGMLAYRKILMRLNINEPLHQQLEKSLEALLKIQDENLDEGQIVATVTLARAILKREWEVTKYGWFTEPISGLKSRVRRRATSNK